MIQQRQIAIKVTECLLSISITRLPVNEPQSADRHDQNDSVKGTALDPTLSWFFSCHRHYSFHLLHYIPFLFPAPKCWRAPGEESQPSVLHSSPIPRSPWLMPTSLVAANTIYMLMAPAVDRTVSPQRYYAQVLTCCTCCDLIWK